MAENQDTKQASKADKASGTTKNADHEKRVQAAKKAARTRRRNTREQRDTNPTERTKPVGRKPSGAVAASEDTSSRTAGLAVEKSGPDLPPADPTVRTSPEAEVQAKQQDFVKELSKTDEVKDQRKAAQQQAEQLHASRSQDQRLAPKLDASQMEQAKYEEQLSVASEWAAPRRAQQMTAVAALNGEVKLFTAGGHIFLETDGEAVLTHDQAVDLARKLQVAFQAVS